MNLRPTKNRPVGQRRYGIFGGTFDPIHLGHLIAAQAAREALDLDRVVFIPAGRPPHKRSRRLAPGRWRLRMVELAIAGNPCFRVSDIELRHSRPSYTAGTLKLLKENFPGIELCLLIGWDQAILLDTWKRTEEIFRLATVAVLRRPGYDPRRIPARWSRKSLFVEIPWIDISSSRIREMVKEGNDIRYLVPEAVRRFILRRKLYRH